MSEQTDFEQAVDDFKRGELDLARQAAERALQEQPSPSWQHLLGLVHCRLGDPARGAGHLRAAVEGEPGNVGFQVMLARSLIDSGQARNVLALPEPGPIHSPATLALWRARAEAAALADETEMAIDSWKRVASAAQRDWSAWNGLANALAAAHRWPNAVEALMNAVKLKPDEAELRRNLAAAFAASDRHEEAVAALEDVEQLSGRSRDTAVARGKSLISLTRFGDAEVAYREALEIQPGDAEATQDLGLLYERTNQLEALSDLLAKASTAGVAEDSLAYLLAVIALRDGKVEEADNKLEAAPVEDDPVRWWRLKARIEDRKGKPAKAFAAMDKMNRATRDFEQWREKGAAYRERLRSLARILVDAGADLPRLDQPERRAPAFLVGFPRSGTTLLDTFLMGHRDTQVLEEIHLLGAAEEQIGRVSELPRRSQDDLRRARAAYFREMDQHVPNDFAGLVVDKLPLNMLGAPFMQAMFPEAPILFAQRHPCDAVLSGFMQSFVMNDAMASFLTIEDSADLYDAVMSGWTAICEAFDLPVHTVVYEELVQDPEGSLRPAVEFLGLEWDPNVLAHRETAKSRGAIITPSYNQVTEPLNTRASGRWKKYRKELEPVLPLLLRWAERLGYRD